MFPLGRPSQETSFKCGELQRSGEGVLKLIAPDLPEFEDED
jgi:hypothetical protein